MKLFRILHLASLACALASFGPLLAQEKSTQAVVDRPAPSFPDGTIWVNSDQQLQIESFTNKILVVVFSDMLSPEATSYVADLTVKYKRYPQIQLIEVLKPSPRYSISRKNLVQYAQKNSAMHPIGMLPNWNNFEYPVKETPSFAVYYRSAHPELVSSGLEGFTAVCKKLDDYCADTNTLMQMPNNQVITEVAGSAFADPLIENPQRIAVDKNNHVYVIDQAHNRILNLDYFGKVEAIYGNGTNAYLDGPGAYAAFNRPQGMCYANGNLYVADTYNHCVRVIDAAEGLVTTLVGNQRVTHTIAQEIKGVNGSIGLPMDVTYWNDRLLVVSATTHQIFEVNERSGECTAFYQAQLANTDGMRECITQLVGGAKVLYLVTNWGQLYAINKKGELQPLPQPKDAFVTAVCEVDGMLYAATLQNQILQLSDKVWKPIAGQSKQSGFVNGSPEEARFHWPSDIVEYNGDLLIADAENHTLRTMSLGKSRRVKTLPLVLTRDLIIDKAANSDGELVLMDTIYVSKNPSEIVVHLNIQNCTIAAGGNNEVHIVPFPGFSLNQEEVKENLFRFKVDQRIESEEVNIELYLTMEDPSYPGVYLIKRSYLNFPVVKDASKSGPQEVVYDMRIWPY